MKRYASHEHAVREMNYNRKIVGTSNRNKLNERRTKWKKRKVSQIAKSNQYKKNFHSEYELATVEQLKEEEKKRVEKCLKRNNNTAIELNETESNLISNECWKEKRLQNALMQKT